MSTVYLAFALAYLSTVVVGLVQLMRRPGSADSLLGALLFGTTGVALVLVLGPALGIPRAVDIALVFALLAAVLGVAFVTRGWSCRRPSGDPPA